MKYLLLLVAICGGYYFYSEKPVQALEINTSRALFKKLETSSVNSLEIIEGASFFALKMCGDASFQVAGGHTTTSCRKKFNSFKEMCVNSIFTDKEKFYSSKAEITPLLKRFINCVGT